MFCKTFGGGVSAQRASFTTSETRDARNVGEWDLEIPLPRTKRLFAPIMIATRCHIYISATRDLLIILVESAAQGFPTPGVFRFTFHLVSVSGVFALVDASAFLSDPPHLILFIYFE